MSSTTIILAQIFKRSCWIGLVGAALVAAYLAMVGSAPEVNNITTRDAENSVSLYFGVGCFWHIQHEFVQAEREILGRNDHELTARTGYAGGKNTGSKGRVCYHNWRGIADYGKLGHAEVVGMVLPESSVGDFSRVYFSLFDPKTKDRVDVNDRGSEYRSLLGLPGGTGHIKFSDVEAAASHAGLTLRAGQGNDPDTFGEALVYVYDTNEFPFHQAEIYHQYHNDFLSPAYGKDYNGLVNLAKDDGRIQPTGCPEQW